MKLQVLLIGAILTISPLNVHAMGNGESSSSRIQASNNTISNNNGQPLAPVVKGLQAASVLLSSMSSVITNLQTQNALNVSTLKIITQAAASRWQSGLIYGIEKIVYFAPQSAIPYLRKTAGLCHEQGADFITFLETQKQEGKSLSDLLRAIRHGMRYVTTSNKVDEALSAHEETINQALQEYLPLLPTLVAGVEVMHATLQQSTLNANTQQISTATQQPHQDEIQIQESTSWLTTLANDDDDDDDQYNPLAEYNRNRKELSSITHECAKTPHSLAPVSDDHSVMDTLGECFFGFNQDHSEDEYRHQGAHKELLSITHERAKTHSLVPDSGAGVGFGIYDNQQSTLELPLNQNEIQIQESPQTSTSWLTTLAKNEDDDDDQYNPLAEYNRNRTELSSLVDDHISQNPMQQSNAMNDVRQNVAIIDFDADCVKDWIDLNAVQKIISEPRGMSEWCG